LNRQDIFLDDCDRNDFLGRLEKNLSLTGCRCYAWVLMSNHIHLLIRTSNRPLGDLMRKVLTGYAISFNRRHGRHGYLYQNRYKSILCQEDEYLLELVRYIHLNPVRAGVVKSLGKLDRYRWSGHSVLVGCRRRTWQDRDEILSHFGLKKREANSPPDSLYRDYAGAPSRKVSRNVVQPYDILQLATFFILTLSHNAIYL
jgi:REP-associated tyrosine transposase